MAPLDCQIALVPTRRRPPAHAWSRRASLAAMSLVAGLAGALGMAAVAAAAPRTDAGPTQIAAAYGLGPSASHEEMAIPAGSGLINLIAALTNILPGAGPDLRINPIGTETVGDQILAKDAAEGANTSLRYLCPDRLYRSDVAWTNHVNANCENGSTDLFPRDEMPALTFAKFGSGPPTSPPPGGSTNPLPCGGTALSFSMNTVTSNVRVSGNVNH